MSCLVAILLISATLYDVSLARAVRARRRRVANMAAAESGALSLDAITQAKGKLILLLCLWFQQGLEPEITMQRCQKVPVHFLTFPLGYIVGNSLTFVLPLSFLKCIVNIQNCVAVHSVFTEKHYSS